MVVLFSVWFTKGMIVYHAFHLSICVLVPCSWLSNPLPSFHRIWQEGRAGRDVVSLSAMWKSLASSASEQHPNSQNPHCPSSCVANRKGRRQLREACKEHGGSKGLGMGWEMWGEVPGVGNTKHKPIGQQDLVILWLRRLTSPNLINYKILGFDSVRGGVGKKMLF